MPNSIEDKLLSLNSRAEMVNQQIIRLNYSKEQALVELENAKNEAFQLFGTSDIDQLRALYKQMLQEESQMIADFEKHIENAEKMVRQVQEGLNLINQKQ